MLSILASVYRYVTTKKKSKIDTRCKKVAIIRERKYLLPVIGGQKNSYRGSRLCFLRRKSEIQSLIGPTIFESASTVVDFLSFLIVIRNIKMVIFLIQHYKFFYYRPNKNICAKKKVRIRGNELDRV